MIKLQKPEEKETKIVNFRLDLETINKLTSIAEKNRLTRTEVIKQLIILAWGEKDG